MQAALDLGRFRLSRAPGGEILRHRCVMSELDKTFPTNDCGHVNYLSLNWSRSPASEHQPDHLR